MRRWEEVRFENVLYPTGLALVWTGLLWRFSEPHRLPGGLWAVADDIYISASFARTMAEGGGLRWYPEAPKVEGITNPLWTGVLAVLHGLPGFSEDRLGAYVFGANVALLWALAFVLCRTIDRFVGHVSSGRTSSIVRRVAVFAASFAPLSLCFWMSSGFETGVVALLSLLAFSEALRAPERIRTVRVAVFVGLAFCARMDAVLACAPALLAVATRVRDRSQLARGAVTLAAILAGAFTLRFAYYGEWLPNTYYLKLAGWPLGQRWPHGVLANSATLWMLLFAVVPLFIFLILRLEAAHRPLALSLAPLVLLVVYSTTSGGDFELPAYGYDRHGAPATVFVPLAIVGALLLRRLRSWEKPLVAMWAAALVIWPAIASFAVREPNAFESTLGLMPLRVSGHRVAEIVDLRQPYRVPDAISGLLIRRGKALREVMLPGARVAVCSAGAMVYFSHRGGVDALGKVDPYIAHLPASTSKPKEARCFRSVLPSGHNKEDTEGLFRLREPEISVIPPPSSQAGRYATVEWRGHRFFARRESRLLDWSKLREVGAR